MKNVVISFKMLDNDEKLPVGYNQLKVHIVFDISVEVMRRARLVADGHLILDPVDSTHACMVSK